MRIFNVAAGLSGACALMAMAASHHLVSEADGAQWVLLAGVVQLSAALAGLIVLQRAARLNHIAGVMILGGATLFAGEIYAHAFLNIANLEMLAPVGGLVLILGWIVLAFAKPA